MERQMSEPAEGLVEPTLYRRRLRSELRKAREAAGMTQRDVAEAMDWSASKLIRIESGAVNISTNDLRVLLGHYNVDSARVHALVNIARTAREVVSRWNIYRDVATPEFIAFLGYESSAAIIRYYDPVLVPGPLQTEEYAQTVLKLLLPENPQRVDPLVDLRMQRQEILVREPTPKLHFIMDEAVIHRAVGGRDIMRRQLQHLQEVTEYPNVSIRVVPFEHGLYPHQWVPYILFEFPEPEDGDVLYVENPQGEYIIRENSVEEKDKGSSPVYYLETFWELEQVARREDTQNYLQDAIARLTTEPTRPAPEKKKDDKDTKQA